MSIQKLKINIYFPIEILMPSIIPFRRAISLFAEVAILTTSSHSTAGAHVSPSNWL